MKKLSVSVLLASSLAAVSSGAFANSSFYLSGMVGGYLAEDVEVLGSNLREDPDFENTYDTDNGFSYGLAVGYQFDNHWRVQLSYSKRDLEADGTNFGNTNWVPESGPHDYKFDSEHDMDTYMLEGFYEFDFGDKLKPYVKLGIGSTRADSSAKIISTSDPLFQFLAANNFLRADGYYYWEDRSTSQFTWNVGIGFRYEISNNFDLGVEFQHLDIGEIRTEFDIADDAWGFQDLSIQEIDVTATYRF